VVRDFEMFYREQYARVLAGSVGLAGEVEVARDATNEAFARALERWPTVRAMASPGGWVQAVALNELRRVLRRRRLERFLIPRRATAAPPVDLVDGAVWDAVRRLPPRQRTAIALRYVHDLPEAAIAEAMGISRGTVSASLAAARDHLRSVLATPDREESLHD
jgi:RNA polymerase sigma factor (sigma-70 family)